MTRWAATAGLLALLGLVAAAVPAAGMPFVEVTGENPSVYRRPVIDDAQLVGQLRAGELYPLLLELDAGLPRPFFRILYGSRPTWVYGGSARRIERPDAELSAGELAVVARFSRSAEQAAGPAVRGLLRAYDDARQRLAADYGFDDLPVLELAADGPFSFDYHENRAALRLAASGAEAGLRLPRSDRLLFQLLVAELFEALEEAESCQLRLARDDRPEAVIEVSRRDWENALDLSLEAFWEMARKENTETLWEVR